MTEDTKKSKSKLKFYVAILGAISITMLVILQYRELGVDEFAFISDVKASEQRMTQSVEQISQDMSKLGKFNMDTRTLVLDNAWWRLEAELDNLQIELTRDPNNIAIKELIRTKLRQQKNYSDQMEALR